MLPTDILQPIDSNSQRAIEECDFLVISFLIGPMFGIYQTSWVTGVATGASGRRLLSEGVLRSGSGSLSALPICTGCS